MGKFLTWNRSFALTPFSDFPTFSSIISGLNGPDSKPWYMYRLYHEYSLLSNRSVDFRSVQGHNKCRYFKSSRWTLTWTILHLCLGTKTPSWQLVKFERWLYYFPFNPFFLGSFVVWFAFKFCFPLAF